MRSRPWFAASFLAAAWVGACGGGGDAPKCIPGASVECACPTGQHGAQTCNAAGAFTACVCALADLDAGGLGGTGGTSTKAASTGGIDGGATLLGSGGAGGVSGTGGSSGGTCVGTPTACGSFSNHSDCASVGCQWKADACQGTPSPCPSPGTSATCTAITGCYWSSLSSTCSGTPVDCITRAERTACIGQGCTWAPAACSGASQPCGSFPNEFACTFAGCTWQSGNQIPGAGGVVSTGAVAGNGGVTSAGGSAGTGGSGGNGGSGGSGGLTGRGGGIGPGGAGGSGGRGGSGGATGTGGIATTGGAGGAGGTTGIATPCGNGALDPGEQCDCGTDTKTLPTGCKAMNGIFFGDGTGCARTCTKEPVCLDAAGKTQACTTACGDGNVDPGEACDDGNFRDGDGCSSACVVENGFTCAIRTVLAAESCAGGTGDCLSLSMIYRDFQPENVAVGGHPDFPFLGTKYNGTVPTTLCVPISSGPAKGNDSTARCWGIAADALLNGKPQPGPTKTCACQFSDWSIGNSDHIPGGYTMAGNDAPLCDGNGEYQGGGSTGSVVNTISTGGEYKGTLTSYTMNGGPVWKGTVPTYKDAASFNQWFNDDPTVNKTFTTTLELPSIGLNLYQYASKGHLLEGFYPLDALNPSQATLCNLWPYWNHGDGSPFWGSCSGDQYLFPPRVIQSDCPNQNPLSNGCWVSVSGRKHDHYFTDEARTYIVYDGLNGISISFYGDDDLFIFINGVLVLDLGGVHAQLPGKVTVLGDPGDAQVTEGGCLDTAGNIIGATAGSRDCSTSNASPPTAATPDDFRVRKVPLGLKTGSTYELAIFGADRHPPESNFQLTMMGFTRKRSECQPD
jgi:cysteine-rich repeat protein